MKRKIGLKVDAFKRKFYYWFSIFLMVTAIYNLFEYIFDNDNSKIISKSGKKVLSDHKLMKKINDKIDNVENSEHYQEILI